jgi:hypothetical protein
LDAIHICKWKSYLLIGISRKQKCTLFSEKIVINQKI